MLMGQTINVLQSFNGLIASLGFSRYLKYSVDVGHYISVAGKQAMIAVNMCSFFIQVAGAYKAVLHVSVASLFF